MKFYFFLLSQFLLLFFSLCSCDSQSREKALVKEVADDFASAYFNLDLKKAYSLCDSVSGRWIKFYASNLTEQDLEVWRNNPEGASHEVKEVRLLSDTSAVVVCEARGYLLIEGVDQPATIAESGVFNLSLVKSGDRWLVRMASLPRSEMRSRGSILDETRRNAPSESRKRD